MKELVALKGGTPLSVTTVVIVFVLGPCASVGVQVRTPVVSMVAPPGGLCRRYFSLLAGISESVARFVTISDVSSEMVWLLCAGRTGALFTSVTTTVKELVALKGGTPLSVTTV